ncbi:hypothetical protein M406DRAFT_72038 [Cryphonectria parasitica EP155]|uniref:Uncharacterized protein n=1 Tax=Cryphonectria parasitica (strain ATCC 38755 / EP155) TaxID=660469 RepID=A0A9P4Y9Q9_CRYP1|nr:uncharacterized protein M406DRAFT_72038 [Cryphonectria parasitica EP155]KAF3769088.1 hypothetical protein M406DRAFT_72038 [Cryphonectria parasitica EP155]
MFCTSLRRRRQWASAVPYLLQHDKMKFRESKLDTHDVNLPLPSTHPGQRYLRFVLLSAADGDISYRHQRVERLYHLSGNNDAAVIWLLGSAGCTSSFIQFQIKLMDDKLDIPLVPLLKIEDLPATLLRFHRSLLQADVITRQPAVQAPSMGSMQSLLPYCAIEPPLSENKVHILSDITVGLADLANKANTEIGRAKIVDYLDPEDAERTIGFWAQEYLA